MNTLDTKSEKINLTFELYETPKDDVLICDVEEDIAVEPVGEKINLTIEKIDETLMDKVLHCDAEDDVAVEPARTRLVSDGSELVTDMPNFVNNVEASKE